MDAVFVKYPFHGARFFLSIIRFGFWTGSALR
jgi:hypothetical protein